MCPSIPVSSNNLSQMGNCFNDINSNSDITFNEPPNYDCIETKNCGSLNCGDTNDGTLNLNVYSVDINMPDNDNDNIDETNCIDFTRKANKHANLYCIVYRHIVSKFRRFLLLCFRYHEFHKRPLIGHHFPMNCISEPSNCYDSNAVLVVAPLLSDVPQHLHEMVTKDSYSSQRVKDVTGEKTERV